MDICCFYDVILLFKSIQGEGCLKITESERTYVLDGPLHFFQTLLSFQHAYIVSRCFLKKKSKYMLQNICEDNSLSSFSSFSIKADVL